MEQKNSFPQFSWDLGTAYDFFVSLVVLHRPTDFGLRSAWAAGIRQRLPTEDREALEKYQESVPTYPPLLWLQSLPEPRDSATMLKAARDLTTLERIQALYGLAQAAPDYKDLVEKVIKRGEWDEADLESLKAYYREENKSKPTAYLTRKLDTWARGVAFSDQILHAMQTYYEAFFAEEERRILPALRESLSEAQDYAQNHDLGELFEKISQGVRYSPERFQGVDQLILAPSFWASPFIFYSDSNPLVILFGARPENTSLVPGELVPESLTVSLSALSDPTRLRILRYLSNESLTPTQLATRLRLRAPTVSHHLRALRKAGLITLIPGPQKKEIHYQTREERLNLICKILVEFITGEMEA